MAAIAVPILPGKLDTWKEWAKEIEGPRSADFDDFNKRHGLTNHQAYLQENPDGSHLVVAIHEGPGADGFMESVARSDHPVDAWFKGKIADIHGLDLSAGPPPGGAPELWIDGGTG